MDEPKGGGAYRALRTARLAAVLLLGQYNEAGAANVLSRAIESAQPCSGLKTEVKRVVSISIGIDRFKSAEVETLKVDVAGDKAKVGLIGSIACQTSDDAFIRGDVFVRFDANADLNLSTCVAASVAVRILSTGGRFGTAVEAFKADIQRSVEKAVVEQTRALCR